MRNNLTAAVAFALYLSAALPAFSQQARSTPEPAVVEVVDLPDSRVRLAKPELFRLREGLPGLAHAFPMTQLIVTELPLSFEAATESMAPDLVDDRGYTYDRREEFWTASGTGDLYHLKEDVDPADLRHWVLLLGNERETLRVTVTTLVELESRVDADMRRALASLEWKRDARRDLQRGKRFRVDPPAELIVARSGRREIELWSVHQIGEAAGPDVRVVVSRYVVPDQIGDLDWFAEQHLASARQLSNFERLETHQVSLGGLPALEMLGEGSAFDDASELGVYQVLALDGDQAYVVQGFVARPQSERFVPVFRRLASSFRRAR